MAYVTIQRPPRPTARRPGVVVGVAAWLKRRLIAHLDAPLRPW